jgi:hypothetical protein
MTLGAGLFASVVLVLAVYNKPFRNVVLCVAPLMGLFYLSSYGYRKYKEHVYAQREDACKTRLGLLDSDDWKNSQRVLAYYSCVSNPKRLLPPAAPDFIPAAPTARFTPLADSDNRIVLIRGGETLKIVPPIANNKSQLDMSKNIPLIYLGHKQEFVITCGNFGEKGTTAVVNNNDVLCP